MNRQISLFFKQPKKAKNAGPSIGIQLETSSATTNSPSKRVGLRAQCIDQLSKWYALLIARGINQVQYDELKDTILGDIKNFESS